MPLITIGSTPIQFPDSAQAPDWSEAVIQFAEAVSASLNTAVGPYDISSQDFLFASTGTQLIPNLQFSSSAVRAAYIKYSIYRTTNDNTAFEAGQIIAIYNQNASVGVKKWQIISESIGGPSGARCTISVEDDGQFYITPTALPGLGVNPVNKISYNARAFGQ